MNDEQIKKMKLNNINLQRSLDIASECLSDCEDRLAAAKKALGNLYKETHLYQNDGPAGWQTKKLETALVEARKISEQK